MPGCIHVKRILRLSHAIAHQRSASKWRSPVCTHPEENGLPLPLCDCFCRCSLSSLLPLRIFYMLEGWGTQELCAIQDNRITVVTAHASPSPVIFFASWRLPSLCSKRTHWCMQCSKSSAPLQCEWSCGSEPDIHRLERVDLVGTQGLIST